MNMISDDEDEAPRLEFACYSCHTQAVETYQEASASVYGSKSHDGFIRARLESRLKMPKFDTNSC